MTTGTHFRFTAWLERWRSEPERRRLILLIAAVGFLIAAEVFGRQSANELGDLATVCLIGFAGIPALRAHRLRPLAPVRGLRVRARWARRRLHARSVDFGVDLRHAPALPPGSPAPRQLIAAVLIALCVATVVLRQLDLPVRDFAKQTFFLPYALAIGVTWLLDLLITAIGGIAVMVCAHDWILARYASTRPHIWRWSLGVTMAALGFASLASALLPAWTPIALALGALSVVILTVRRGVIPNFALVWRNRKHGNTLQSINLREFLPLDFAVLHLIWLPPVLWSIGASGPITRALGGMSAWVGGMGILAFTCGALMLLLACHRRDPSRRSPTRLHANGLESDWPQIAELLTPHGVWLRTPGEAARPGDVRIELRSRAARADERGWPWPTTRAELAKPEFIDFLIRRDRAMSRQHLIDVITGQISRAKRRKFANGCGFWIAPHQWCFPGLMRDEAERKVEDQEWVLLDNMIGRPWHELLTQHQTHEFYRVFTALQVDVLFVADEITPALLQSVLEWLFEHHDWYPTRRLEEFDLRAVQGARLILHDWESKPRQPDGYPEPDYEQIGRARILHVFKDRGGEDARADVPSDDIRMPRLGPRVLV